MDRALFLETTGGDLANRVHFPDLLLGVEDSPSARDSLTLCLFPHASYLSSLLFEHSKRSFASLKSWSFVLPSPPNPFFSGDLPPPLNPKSFRDAPARSPSSPSYFNIGQMTSLSNLVETFLVPASSASFGILLYLRCVPSSL